MTGETNVRERVRRRRQRGRSVGVLASSSSSDAGYGPISEDPEEEGLEPSAAMEEEIENFVPPAPSAFVVEDEEAGEGSRIRANGYAKEHRLAKVHKMIMRDIPVIEMARALGVSESTVLRDRKELEKRLRQDAQNLNIDHHIGDTMAFFKEAQSMAMRHASSKKLPVHTRLAALRTAVSSRNDMHKFFQAAGVYNVLQFTAASDGTNDINKLMELTQNLLEGEGNEALDVLAAASAEEEETLELESF